MTPVGKFVFNSYSDVWHKVENIAKDHPIGARFLSIPLAISDFAVKCLLCPVRCIEEISLIPQGKKEHAMKACAFGVGTIILPLFALVSSIILVVKMVWDPVQVAKESSNHYEKILIEGKWNSLEENPEQQLVKSYCEEVKISEENQTEAVKEILNKEINKLIVQEIEQKNSPDEPTLNRIKQSLLDNVELAKVIKEKVQEIQKPLKMQEFKAQWKKFKTDFTAKKEFTENIFLHLCATSRINKSELKAKYSLIYLEKTLDLLKAGKLEEKFMAEFQAKQAIYDKAKDEFSNLLKIVNQEIASEINAIDGRALVDKADTGIYFWIEFPYHSLNTKKATALREKFGKFRDLLIAASTKLTQNLKFNQEVSDEFKVRLDLHKLFNFENKFKKSCFISIILRDIKEGKAKSVYEFCAPEKNNALHHEANIKKDIYLQATEEKNKALEKIGSEDESSKAAVDSAFTSFLDTLREASLEDAKAMKFVFAS